MTQEDAGRASVGVGSARAEPDYVEDVDGEEETASEPGVALFQADESDRFRDRWTEIQTSFVDRPRESVEEADRLVADVLQRLTTQFTDERSRLEAQWDRGDDVSTEELRVSLQHYRAFFERLLAV